MVAKSSVTQDKNIKDAWESLARLVLSVIFVDPGAVIPVIDVVGSDLTLWPEKERKIWQAVLSCVDVNTMPTPQAVSARNEAVELAYLNLLAQQWDEKSSEDLIYNTEQMALYGKIAAFRGIGRDVAEFNSTDEFMSYIGQVLVDIEGLSGHTVRDGSAAAVSQSAYEQLESNLFDPIPSGLSWFDALTGGVWIKKNYWVAAAYKSGKTTLIRNILLNMARDGHPVDMLCAEGTREGFVLDCQAMIATSILLDEGVPADKINFSGLYIQRVWKNRHNALTKQQLSALNKARAVWEVLDVRVWDGVDGIRDLASFKNRIRRSKMEHGSLVHIADYSQLFGSDSMPIYERQSSVAKMVQNVCIDHGVAIVMLAQKSEEGVKSSGGYSANVKGGGDASAAADYLFIPKIDHEKPGEFEIELKFSRNTPTGKYNHRVHGASGLILDPWATRPTAEDFAPMEDYG